ncbi:Lysophospholipase L1 [Georgenia satyanarayanai]|uniref:Lysophospholipase L1 n=1 Tax=Georgenia satyanarayanai TaxID=860221 RepID=A0A2Y9A7B0_9MICO|nr:SGNH/GDSL hydrolase family protein [Georgenia satyanarayanai]PYG01039.1 lysophospholipase L1-like esterase [Georgenia satyanarayanai]SSA39278.1 Lysophospholipase L1 [Georgenia satyanarayanai]
MSTQDTTAPPWARYVAVGDSLTEGMVDPDPTDPGRHRGWADLLASALSRRRTAAGQPPLEYANLAVRGRLLRQILSEQLPTARDLRPDLVSITGGGNDILRPGADVDALLRSLEDTVAGLRAAGTDVLLVTGSDPAGAPVIRLTRAKVAVLNTGLWSIAHRHGAHVLDLWGMRAIQDWRMWAEDRIHLSTAGHERVAQAALVGLGLTPDHDAWDDPLSPLPPEARADRWRGNARWAQAYALPWVQRRLRRQSSGDLRRAKYPEPVTVETS